MDFWQQCLQVKHLLLSRTATEWDILGNVFNVFMEWIDIALDSEFFVFLFLSAVVISS